MEKTDSNTVCNNALTVDVEDYFQVSAFEKHISVDSWSSLPCRVERTTNRILDLFAAHGAVGTFFILGWVAEHYPQLVRRISSEGHEIASHGFSHQRVTQLQPQEFRRDVSRTKKLLEDISGQAVMGYRAPSFSIDERNLWALDILSEEGYRYSSSIYPISHDHYGMPEAHRFAHYPRDHDLLEIPVSTLALFGLKLPCGGGGYFRLFPYCFSRWAIRHVNRAEQMSCVFYFHPWEIDPGQPRVAGLSWKARFRHYLNLKSTEQRLTRLLEDFSWDRMDQIYLDSTVLHPRERLMENAGNMPAIKRNMSIL